MGFRIGSVVLTRAEVPVLPRPSVFFHGLKTRAPKCVIYEMHLVWCVILFFYPVGIGGKKGCPAFSFSTGT